MRTARIGAALIAVGVLLGSATARGQTTSARSESLEISSRADELLASGREERAAPLYQRALEIDDHNERAYLGLSAVLDARQRPLEALELLRTAESVLGWTAGIAVQRGIHQSRLKRWDQVVTTLTPVLKQDPRSFEAAYYLAAAHTEQRAWPEAITSYDVYLRHRPEALAERDLLVRTRRAYALLGAGKHAAARLELEGVLARDPTRGSARMLLFTALARGGDCVRALALVPELGTLPEVAPTLAYNAAVCRFRVGDAREALAGLEAARRRAPLPPESHLLTARIHIALGKDDEATRSYRAALAAGVPAELELARWLTRRGEHAQVVALLWPSAERTDDPEALEVLASALAQTGDFERAAVACARSVELAPTRDRWLLHGRVQLKRGRWAEAEAAFERVLAAEPTRARAARGLRQALAHQASEAFRAGDRDGAHARLARAHQVDRSADDVAHNLALIELERGNPRRSIALLQGRVDQPASRVLLGRAHMQVGNDPAAARQLERVVADQNASRHVRAQALSHLAYVIARSNPDRAMQLIARAREQGDLGPASTAMLTRAGAEVGLALAERTYTRGAFAQLQSDLAAIASAELDARARVRLALLAVFEVGQRRGLAAALTELAAITNDQLESVSTGALQPAAMRRALALYLGHSFAANPSEYARYLRMHANALRGEPAAAHLLTALYDKLLDLAIARRSAALAGQLIREAPPGLRSPAFQHNAIISAATTTRGHKSFGKTEVLELEKLAGTVPEALVNLAVDAEARDDHAAVIRYLRRIPAGARTAQVIEWLRWKELFHAAP
ncbi:MAG TPA: tetratricopeptide repeat protein [Kofleriaceae bacterium]|nr:tetratricopeptide repeat protein [Kofleriaceae bacterium]